MNDMKNKDISITEVKFFNNKQKNQDVCDFLLRCCNTLGELYVLINKPNFEKLWMSKFDIKDLNKIYKALELNGFHVYFSPSDKIKEPENISVMRVNFTPNVPKDTFIKNAIFSRASNLGDLSKLSKETILSFQKLGNICVKDINDTLKSFGLNELIEECPMISPTDNYQDAKEILYKQVKFGEGVVNYNIQKVLKENSILGKKLGDLTSLKKSQLLTCFNLADKQVSVISDTLKSYGLSIIDDSDKFSVVEPEDCENPKALLVNQVRFSDSPTIDTLARKMVYSIIYQAYDKRFSLDKNVRQKFLNSMSQITLGELYEKINNINFLSYYKNTKKVLAIKETLIRYGFDVEMPKHEQKKLKYGFKIFRPEELKFKLYRISPDSEFNFIIHKILRYILCDGNKERYDNFTLCEFLQLDHDELAMKVGSVIMKEIDQSLSVHNLAFNSAIEKEKD